MSHQSYYLRQFCNKGVAGFTGGVMSALSRNTHCNHISHHIVFSIPLCKGKLLFDSCDASLKQYQYLLPSLFYSKLRLHFVPENRGHCANSWRKTNILSCALSSRFCKGSTQISRRRCVWTHKSFVTCHYWHCHSCLDKQQHSVWPG